jgi:hypothetical protein
MSMHLFEFCFSFDNDLLVFPQDACDRKSSQIKNKVAREVNSGLDCSNPADFVYLINSKDGIKNTKTSLVTLEVVPRPKVSIPNVSLMSNFKVESEGLRVWRSYNQGPGLLLPWMSMEVEKGAF